MAEFISVKIGGLEETTRKFKLLTENVGKRALRRALRKGANVIRDEARAGAQRLNDPLTPEMISKNIVVQGVRAKSERQAGGPVMRVGVLGGARQMSKYGEFGGAGKGNPGGDTWYWRLLEFGTSKMAAKPFMRNAMVSGAEKAFGVLAEAMDTEIDKELAKLK